MPTLCELRVEAKKKGITGISNMTKSALEAFMKTGKKKPDKPVRTTKATKKEESKKEEPKEEPKKTTIKIKPKPKKKKEEKKPEPPKLLQMKEIKEIEPDRKSIEELKKNNTLGKLEKLRDKIDKLVKGEGTQGDEKKNAQKKLDILKKAVKEKRKDMADARKAKKDKK
tara:strand:- start:37 stop:543 length:507 start_codon:yes stop_codon:yes gene_type:complete